MNLRDHLVRLYEYEADCTKRVSDSLERAQHAIEHGGVAAEAAPFVRAVGLFAHVQSARQIWLSRLEQMSPPEDGLFPAWDLAKAISRAASLDVVWLTYARSLQLQRASLEAAVQYTTSAGAVRRSTVLEILTHVVNHSSYHRGQIATLVAQCGADPAVTDFIVFTRVEASDGIG